MSTALSLRAHSGSPPTPLLSDPHGDMVRLRTRLRSMSDRRELLFDLLGFGLYVEMAVTRDGMLVARTRRTPHTGFDVFLGKISLSVRQRTGQIWRELEPAEKTLVLLRLRTLGIQPDAVGIIVEMCVVNVGTRHKPSACGSTRT